MTALCHWVWEHVAQDWLLPHFHLTSRVAEMAASDAKIERVKDKGYVLVRTTLQGPVLDFLSFMREQTPDCFVHDSARPWVKGLLPADSHHLTLISDIFYQHIMPPKDKDADAYQHGRDRIHALVHELAGDLATTSTKLAITGLGVFPSPGDLYVCLHAKIGLPESFKAVRTAITSRLPSYICFEPWNPHVSLAYMTPESAAEIMAGYSRLPFHAHLAMSGEWIFSGAADELL